MSRIGGDFKLVANSEICFPKFLLGQKFVCVRILIFLKKIAKFNYVVFALNNKNQEIYDIMSLIWSPFHFIDNIYYFVCKICTAIYRKQIVYSLQQ